MAKKKNPPLEDKPQRLNLSVEGREEKSERNEPTLFASGSVHAAPVDEVPENAEKMDENSISTVGERLKFERERKGYSLHEMADILRLRPRQIQALEAGDHDNLPGQAFVVGFLRSYANALGLDAIAIVALYKSEHAGQLGTPQLAFPEPTSEGRLPGSGLLVGTCLLALLAFGGWYVYQSDKGSGLDAVSELPDQLMAKLQKVTGSSNTAPDIKTEQTVPSTSSVTMAETATSKPIEKPDAVQSIVVADGPKQEETSSVEKPPSDVLAGNSQEVITQVAEVADTEPNETLSASDQVAELPSQTQEVETETAQELTEKTDGIGTEGTEADNIETADSVADGSTTDAVQTESQNADAVQEQQEVVATAEGADTTEDTDSIENEASSNQATASQSEQVATLTVAEPEVSTTVEAAEEPQAAPESQALEEPATIANVIVPLENKPVFEQETLTPVGPALENPESSNSESGNNEEPERLGVQNSDARIVLMAHQESWVQILTAGNEVVIERILGPGDTFMVPALDKLKFSTANAAGIEIRVDGQKLAALGGYGSIIQNLDLDPQSLREQFSASE